MVRTITAPAAHAEAAPWIERLGRAGLVARGLVYVLVGYLAVRVAFGHGDDAANKQGALQKLKEQRFGTPLLVVLAGGIAGYAIWRFADALWGERREPETRKRNAKRLASAGKGAIYVGLLASTISVIAGSAPKQGEQAQKTWTAEVLGWPGGRGIVIAAGAVVVAAGIALVVRGLGRKFLRSLDLGGLSAGRRKAVEALGVAGHVARGAVAGLAGLLLIKAAADFDPNDAKGVDGTLRTIAGQPYGQTLLVLAAAGLGAFGLYSVAEARYRRM